METSHKRAVTRHWQAWVIRINNRIIRWRRVKVKSGNLLLLVPHCLQMTACGQNIKTGIDQCRRCGQCDMAGLIALRDRYGILCSLAVGGRQALEFLRRPEVRAVVAVACEEELVDGIRTAFPVPVWAVPNLRPSGPCKDTRVPLDEVESAIAFLVNGA